MKVNNYVYYIECFEFRHMYVIILATGLITKKSLVTVGRSVTKHFGEIELILY